MCHRQPRSIFCSSIISHFSDHARSARNYVVIREREIDETENRGTWGTYEVACHDGGRASALSIHGLAILAERHFPWIYPWPGLVWPFKFKELGGQAAERSMNFNSLIVHQVKFLLLFCWVNVQRYALLQSSGWNPDVANKRIRNLRTLPGTSFHFLLIVGPVKKERKKDMTLDRQSLKENVTGSDRKWTYTQFPISLISFIIIWMDHKSNKDKE